MKPHLARLSLAILTIVLLNACEKESTYSFDRPISATQIIPSNPVLAGVLGTGHNIADTIRLTNSTVWFLDSLVFVDQLDVLIIEQGTIIKGNVGGGLIITRGAKILAEGTAAEPIIFTSSNSTPAPGDWSGVILLGNASSNHSLRVQVEGVPSNPAADATYGGVVGTNDADNSGILKYVRIEYAGFTLTLAGVGSNTVIDYVEVFKAKDDAFQFFGGTVNATHLLAVDALDDMFDTENGYRGTITYVLGLADTTRAANGLESDNNETGSTATPLTNPTYNYITLVGVHRQARASVTRAAHLRRNSRFSISNSIFIGYNYGLSQDRSLGNTTGTFTNNYVHAFVTPFLTELGRVKTAVTAPATNTGYISPNPDPSGISMINPYSRSAVSNFISVGDAEEAGAFGIDENWATGWTRLW